MAARPATVDVSQAVDAGKDVAFVRRTTIVGAKIYILNKVIFLTHTRRPLLLRVPVRIAAWIDDECAREVGFMGDIIALDAGSCAVRWKECVATMIFGLVIVLRSRLMSILTVELRGNHCVGLAAFNEKT